jgi:hypothetical protein
MKPQATRLDVIEAQNRKARRRELMTWIIGLPTVAAYFAFVLTYPLWS